MMSPLQIAGVEDAPPPSKKSVPKDDWSKQLERVYSSAGGGGGSGGGGGGGSRSGGGGGNPMVKVGPSLISSGALCLTELLAGNVVTVVSKLGYWGSNGLNLAEGSFRGYCQSEPWIR